MINVFQNEKEYTISVTIPIKKVNFSETPSKRDFEKFAEEVFEAYTNIIVEALEARMNAYDTMQRLVKKIQQYKLGELTKSELKQIAKALYWVEDKSDIGKYTFQDLIDVIDEYREIK